VSWRGFGEFEERVVDEEVVDGCLVRVDIPNSQCPDFPSKPVEGGSALDVLKHNLNTADGRSQVLRSEGRQGLYNRSNLEQSRAINVQLW
jgi:hypothetical protein